MTHCTEPEHFARELSKVAKGHEKNSKVVGDYHWRKAQQITGGGDYTEADAGEEMRRR